MDANLDIGSGEEAELSDADIDAFIRRNRDELNRSIAEARADLAAGKVSTLTMEEIIAKCMAKA